jgi:DNA-binding HxlR family transcriptional regulator
VSDEQQVLRAALNQVGDKWSLLVIHALLQGPRRFRELSEELAGIAPNVLSQRLRQLEALGLVVSRPYSRRPVRLTYGLTARGRGLGDAVRVLVSWGAQQSPAVEVPHHGACGTPLEVRWFCPTCATVVDEPAENDLWLV